MSEQSRDAIFGELKSIRSALWDKSRSPQGREERERYDLAHRVNDLINVLGRRAQEQPQEKS
jgi:hypothetical protein